MTSPLLSAWERLASTSERCGGPRFAPLATEELARLRSRCDIPVWFEPLLARGWPKTPIRIGLGAPYFPSISEIEEHVRDDPTWPRWVPISFGDGHELQILRSESERVERYASDMGLEGAPPSVEEKPAWESFAALADALALMMESLAAEPPDFRKEGVLSQAGIELLSETIGAVRAAELLSRFGIESVDGRIRSLREWHDKQRRAVVVLTVAAAGFVIMGLGPLCLPGRQRYMALLSLPSAAALVLWGLVGPVRAGQLHRRQLRERLSRLGAVAPRSITAPRSPPARGA